MEKEETIVKFAKRYKNDNDLMKPSSVLSDIKQFVKKIETIVIFSVFNSLELNMYTDSKRK